MEDQLEKTQVIIDVDQSLKEIILGLHGDSLIFGLAKAIAKIKSDNKMTKFSKLCEIALYMRRGNVCFAEELLDRLTLSKPAISSLILAEEKSIRFFLTPITKILY